MKKCGSTATSSMDIDGLVDTTNSLSLGTTTLAVDKNATDGCQHFSIRQYVADIREKNPKGCNPFGGKNYHKWEKLKAPLNVPQSKWWRCENSVREIVISSTPDLAEGEGTKAPIEVKSLDESQNGEIQENSPLGALATVATLLKEQESAEEGASTCALQLQLPVKRPSPLLHNTDLILRKRSKVTGKSACSYQEKEKPSFKSSGSGANPLVRKMYEKLAAGYTSEANTLPPIDCLTNKNSADIDVLGPRNKYMTRGKDLIKPKKNSGKRHRDTN